MFHVPDQPRGLVPEDADFEAGHRDGLAGTPRVGSSHAYHDGYAAGAGRRILREIDESRARGS